MSTVTMSKPTAGHSEEFEGLFREHYLLVYRTACLITAAPKMLRTCCRPFSCA